MKVLIACEESQEVTAAFIALGHDTMSCDKQYAGAKGLPHYQGDMFDIDFSRFDLIIVHPPCTHIANSGNKHYAGTQLRKDAADFIWRCWNIPCRKLAIENPIGQVNTYLPEMPRPQIIQPYQFGHMEQKSTCLWTRNLPTLIQTDNVYDEMMKLPKSKREKVHYMSPGPDRQRNRSRTYPGIAAAMAQQWGGAV